MNQQVTFLRGFSGKVKDLIPCFSINMKITQHWVARLFIHAEGTAHKRAEFRDDPWAVNLTKTSLYRNIYLTDDTIGHTLQITLTKPFAPNTNTDGFDLVQIGITGLADAAVFNALKSFQAASGLPATGTAKPDDDTIRLLNQKVTATPDGYYIWRTVEDAKVRGTHAQYNRTIRSWSDTPDPGEEFNCHCWAEKFDVPKDVVPALKSVLRKLNGFDISKQKLSATLPR